MLGFTFIALHCTDECYLYCMFAGIGQGKSNGPLKPVTTDSILSMVVLVV
jgi:hypothetical protein